MVYAFWQVAATLFSVNVKQEKKSNVKKSSIQIIFYTCTHIYIYPIHDYCGVGADNILLGGCAGCSVLLE